MQTPFGFRPVESKGDRIGQETLRAGDHIYSWRKTFIHAHHGIYVGDDMVIHVTRGRDQKVRTRTVIDLITAGSRSTTPCLVCSSNQGTATATERNGVMSSCLSCFLAGGHLYRFQYAATTDPGEVVVRRAKDSLSAGFESYGLVKNNCERFATYCKTGYTQRSSFRIDKEKLKAGDHIYSWRTAYIYSHHGIYVGDDKVIHFTSGRDQEVCSSDQVTSAATGTQGVRSSSLSCFLAGGHLCRFEYAVSPDLPDAVVNRGTCSTATANSGEVVVRRANYLLSNGFGSYNLLKNNCEHFATYCKIGSVHPSRQVVFYVETVLDSILPGSSFGVPFFL